MKRILSSLLTLTLLASPSLFAQGSIPAFRNGDKVVLMGDSITHGGHYHSWIWLWYMTHFPDMRIDLVNAGMGGETSEGMLARLEQDVFDREPTYFTLTFGMNDTGYFDVYLSEKKDSLVQDRYEKSIACFHRIEEELAERADFNVVMIGGSPYDETTKALSPGFIGKNDDIAALISEQKAAAERHGWGFVDFNEPMAALTLREQQRDSLFTFCRQDRVHPDADGQMVMAYLFLKAQGMTGLDVADMEIDAGRRKVVRSGNCTVSALSGGKKGIAFNYLARSLPFPLDSVAQNGWANVRSARDAARLVPILDELSREGLTIKGLTPGSYRLRIDGEPIDELTDKELAQGVNLAAYPHTPQYRQASTIMYLNEERLLMERKLVEYRWLNYEYLRDAGLMGADNIEALNFLQERGQNDFFVAISLPYYKAAVDPVVRKTWQDYIDKLVDTIYSINKPRTRRIELERIK